MPWPPIGEALSPGSLKAGDPLQPGVSDLTNSFPGATRHGHVESRGVWLLLEREVAVAGPVLGVGEHGQELCGSEPSPRRQKAGALLCVWLAKVCTRMSLPHPPQPLPGGLPRAQPLLLIPVLRALASPSSGRMLIPQ